MFKPRSSEQQVQLLVPSHFALTYLLPHFFHFLLQFLLCSPQAFLAFDEEKKGDIPTADFKRILDNFCFKTSASNFKAILGKCSVTENGRVDYAAFLTTFNLTVEEVKILSFSSNLKAPTGNFRQK